MAPATKFYLVSAEALPEIFIKVAEAKRMLQSGEVRTAGDAAWETGRRFVSRMRNAIAREKNCERFAVRVLQ